MTEAVAEGGAYKAAPVDIDPKRLAALFAEYGLGVPAAVTELIGGHARSFRIDRVDGAPLVLKAFNDAVPYATGKETYASQLLRELDVPMTRFLASDESRTRLPFRYTIANYLPGRQVMTFKDAGDVPDLYRQMGEMLRKLHTVPVPGYGAFDTDGLHDPVPTNTEYMNRRFTHGIGRFRHFGGDEALAGKLETIFAAGADLIAESRGAVFAHDDFQPHNVLAERGVDGRLHLTGLLDFGNARASDPVCDLAKALFCSEHDAPGSSPHLLEGYGPIDHSNPQAALRVYTLVHRVTMWWWLRHVGVIGDGEHNALIDDLERMAAEAA